MIKVALLVFGFVAGVVSSLVIEELLRLAYRRASRAAANSMLGRIVLRRRHIRRRRIEQLGSRWRMSLGGVSIPWVSVGYGPYRHDNIVAHYHPEPRPLPEEVQRAHQDLRADLARRTAVGEDVPFDADVYGLIRFHVSSRAGPAEEPRLVLHFGPTTYYTMLVTDRRLDVPMAAGGATYTLRDRYAADADLRIRPVPEFATFWNVGLSVVTADRYLVIGERGSTAVDPGVFAPAVAEGASRVKDATGAGAPDQLTVARRGMDEELGIPLHSHELTWLTFGANPVVCQYALIGCVYSRFSWDEIMRRRSVGVKDAWESRQLHAVEFTPQAVADFCGHEDRRFTPFATAAIVYTLIHEFGLRDVEAAFEGLRIRSSHELP